MTLSVGEFDGNILYLDTMILYAFSRGIEISARDLFQRIEQGGISACTSVLTFDELAYRLLLAFIRNHYPGSPLDHLRADEMKMLEEFAPAIGNHLDELRAFPNLVVLDVFAADLEGMNDAMISFQLRPRDALHWAVMQRVGCFDLASNDPHFDRIPALRRFSL